MMNVLNGGAHADNNVDVQEFMLFPLGASSFSEALRWGAEIFHTLKGVLSEKGYSTSVGDEGGFAPNLGSNDEAVELILSRHREGGLPPGRADLASLSIPPRASSTRDGKLRARGRGAQPKSTSEMIEFWQDWVSRYPIVSIEDGLAEEPTGRAGAQFTARRGTDVQIVGDDLFVTNPRSCSVASTRRPPTRSSSRSTRSAR